MIFVCNDRIYTGFYYSNSDLTYTEFDLLDIVWEEFICDRHSKINIKIIGWLYDNNIAFTLKVGSTFTGGTRPGTEFSYIDELVWFGISIPNPSQAAHFKLIWYDHITYMCTEEEWENEKDTKEDIIPI